MPCITLERCKSEGDILNRLLKILLNCLMESYPHSCAIVEIFSFVLINRSIDFLILKLFGYEIKEQPIILENSRDIMKRLKLNF